MTALLTFYVLMWPVLVAVMLYVIAKGFFADARAAKREGKSII